MGDGSIYFKYEPSTAAAAVATTLFAIVTIYHVWQMCRKRTWYFTAFIIGGLFEVVGFAVRIINAEESPNYSLGPYIVQTLLILLAPALFAASIYMILARFIRVTGGESLSPIRSTWLTKIFVAGDVLSFLAQGGGGGILSNADTPSEKDKGEIVITTGLIIQLLFFGLFILVSILYHLRLRRAPTPESRALPWQLYFAVLYTASVLIMVRGIFRLIEYVQGEDGELLSKEIYLYIFDALLMFITMNLFNIWHPSGLIPSRKKEEKSADQDIEAGSSSAGTEMM